MGLKIRPARGWLLVRPIPISEWRRSSLVLPDDAQIGPPRALVLAVGPPKKDEHGDPQPYSAKVGDTILHGTGGAAVVCTQPEALVILRDESVLGVLDEDAGSIVEVDVLEGVAPGWVEKFRALLRPHEEYSGRLARLLRKAPARSDVRES